MRVLVAEDDDAIRNVLKAHLGKKGYAVDEAGDGDDASAFLATTLYDLVLIDVMMPGMSGFDVVSRYRKRSGSAPVIFLTALDSVEDKVKGLDIGGDDYLVKPFSFEELDARIRVILRRNADSASSVLKVDDLELDMKGRRVSRGGVEISLSQKEYSILEYMMLNRDQVITRDRLIEHVWNFDYSGESNVIDVYIRYLRKKIDTEGRKPLIHTVRGIGYVLKE